MVSFLHTPLLWLAVETHVQGVPFPFKDGQEASVAVKVILAKVGDTTKLSTTPPAVTLSPDLKLMKLQDWRYVATCALFLFLYSGLALGSTYLG